MAMPASCLLLLLFLTSFSHCFGLGSTMTQQGPKGFSIKMIPRYSEDSPLYQKNLPREERFQQLLELSHARAYHLSVAPRPAVTSSGVSFSPVYVVQVGIGTPEANFYLMLDTGSDSIWVQGADCERCFNVKGGSFHHENSSSFSYLKCYKRQFLGIGYHPSKCSYKARYGDKSATLGYLGTDIFTFPSDDPTSVVEIPGIVFGVGYNNNMSFDGKDNKIAGILGLGAGTLSFGEQICDTGLGLFSYCLPTALDAASSLRFGNDAKLFTNKDVRSTPLTILPNEPVYYLNCSGISVAGITLGLSPDTFKRKPDGTGGMIIDSGTTFTLLPPEAYNRLKWAVDQYLLPYKLKRVMDSPLLCYDQMWWGLTYLPIITFHFEGADFDIDPYSGFILNGDNFCLAFATFNDEIPIILGSLVQRNTRVLYDVGQKQLFFQPEKC